MWQSAHDEPPESGRRAQADDQEGQGPTKPMPFDGAKLLDKSRVIDAFIHPEYAEMPSELISELSAGRGAHIAG
jgi:hypothetical protein